MRLIARFNSRADAEKLCSLFNSNSIDCHIDKEEEFFEVWVKEEDKVLLAESLYQDFLSKKIPIEVSIESRPQEKKPQIEQEERKTQGYLAPWTRFFIGICLVIFLLSFYQEKAFPKRKTFFPRFTDVQKKLMYDYPSTIDIAEKLTEQYGVINEADLKKLPTSAEELVRELEKEPIWGGVYNVIVHWQERSKLVQAKLFGDIRKGDIWRVWTPTILHVEFLHFLFNMLWLWLLGKMIEKNIKGMQYLLFIAITAAFTNTLQYLMTGPFFMGFSGVVAAMAGYIWVRKKKAPWENYPIDFGTLIFLGVFVFGMLALQIVAFFLEILHIVSFQLGIANTAHISGVALGMLLGRMSVFQRKM